MKPAPWIKGVSGEVVTDTPETGDDSRFLPYQVVAIGASAGGVEAYLQLFDSLPADTGMTFVLIPHLSRDHESHLVEILSRNTPMTVAEVQHDMQPQCNHVYILPPNKWARMHRGKFILEARPADQLSRPINHFFQSLAVDQKTRAIGIILSGTDSDGAVGLSDIKSEGGISIVQAPDTAQYRDMPIASIAADHVDLILPPAQIGPELARISRQLAKPETLVIEAAQPGDDEHDFLRILTMLRNVSAINFRHYKPTTLRRRLLRRMLLERIDTLSDYARFLQTNPRELRALQEDLLINVSRFFRDPDVFDALKADIFPRMFEDRGHDQQLRIWVPGCAAGQEAYTIAICLLEFLADRSSDLSVQIFGTDASDLSIAKARLGTYPETLNNEVSAERLRRFFTKVDKGYQVGKRVRDLCIFARQNLSVDPPFSRLDLVSCRNVLIYFAAELQNQVVPTFHYALRPNGYLLLGASESIRGYSHLFQQIDRKHKFFIRLESASRLHLSHMPRVQPIESKGQAVLGADNWGEVDLQRAADRIVLPRYTPPGVVINDKAEILQTRGHTSPFLEISPGTASLQLFRMAREGLVSPLREAVERSIQLNIPVRLDHVQVPYNEELLDVAIEVLPIPTVATRARTFIVLFVTNAQPGNAAASIKGLHDLPESLEERDLQLIRLKQDLESNKLYLNTLLDDREAKNQELVSANEEIQSANEELQSTNEELETTKEELQSANEELQTVNEELRQRNFVLTLATNDLSNLLNSVNLPVLMLGSDLNIRHFTPPTQRLINLRSTDIGRPLADIRMNFTVENLDTIFSEVLETLAPREIEFQDSEGRWHHLRIRPYRTTENKIDGLVLVIVDVDQLRRSQQELREARDFASSIIENVPLPLAVLNLDLRIRTVNDAFRSLSGPAGSFDGRLFGDVAARLGIDGIQAQLEGLVSDGASSQRFDFEREAAGEQRRVFRVSGCVLQPHQERVLLVTIEDVTTGSEAQRLLVIERERLAKEVQSTTQQLGRTQEELRALTARLMQTQEDERRRVARELHDDVSQKLALLANDTQRLEDQIKKNPAAAKELRDLNRRISELSQTIRGISHRLHPSAIEDLGLSSALKNIVEEFGARENMPVSFTRRNVPADLPLDVATNVYRIAQEALRNVSKHAGKTHLKVSLVGFDQRIQLEVADFGEGFDASSGRSGLGLVSMEERARLLHGTLNVESAPGKGTRVTVQVPVPEQTEQPS